MKWTSFAILVGVLLGLQAGGLRLLGLGEPRIMPDLLLVTAVVLAYRGASDEVLPACWVLGLAKDVTTAAPLGAYALCFGALGLLIVHVKELVYGEHTLGLMVLTLAGSVMIEQAVTAMSIGRGDLAAKMWGQMLGVVLLSGVFSAGLSPYVQWVLLKLHRQLGLETRRSYRKR